METARVDNCYRPLRIAWAVHSGDLEAFRQAVKLSHTLWGGRFNPIVLVDRKNEAKSIVELFRVDVILPVGASVEAKEFPKRFPHLINPFHSHSVFVKGMDEHGRAQVLDIDNAVEYWREKPE